MNTFRFPDISSALPKLMNHVLDHGEEIGSRAGRVKEVRFQHLVLTEPWRREITTPSRRAILPAQIAETMWVLAGRNDIDFLQHYLPRAADFSDDGETWRAGYGPRLRKWAGADGETDQLAEVVRLLKEDRATRRAVINIFDPARDFGDSKDIPCNNWLHFLSRNGKLDLHVAIRSNDLMWGWSGINAFEWSALQEIVAGLTGQMVGELHFSISSLHVYEKYWDKARRIGQETLYREAHPAGTESPRFDGNQAPTLPTVDGLIKVWFELEEEIRNGVADLGEISSFPEPMMRSWLQVIQWWWTGEESALEPLKGTPLYAAAKLSPRTFGRKSTEPRHLLESQPPAEQARMVDESAITDVEPRLVEVGPVGDDPFVTFVLDLHKEKHQAYGDSWKRRGEQISVMANIARKVDRLGIPGGGDTSADTAIDLLCYMAKYRLWLVDYAQAPMPDIAENRYASAVTLLSDTHIAVAQLVRLHSGTSQYGLARVSDENIIAGIRTIFSQLENRVTEHPNPMNDIRRVHLTERLLANAALLARRTWEAEQPEAITVTEDRNATRSWAGYGE